MIAKFQRTLKSGTQYDALIPRSTGATTVRLQSANTHDTIKAIQEVVATTLHQTQKIAVGLKGGSLMTTCRNIWDFIYHHIQYKNDEPGKEQIRTPARDWADRTTGVDCDDYTTFASSLLTNLGIAHQLRITDYGKGWQHIYVIVPKSGRFSASLDQKRRDDYIVIDCVPDKFDYEVAYHKKMDIPMELHMLSGIPDEEFGQEELGKTIFGKIFQKVGNVAKGAAQGVAKAAVAVVKTVRTVATTPVRLGILAWMKTDFRKGAQRLRWGYVSYAECAKFTDFGPKAHAEIVDALKRLNNTFVNNLGGQANVLRMAIVTGKGNEKREVPSTVANLQGLGALDSTDSDMAVLNQITGVYSRVSAPDLKPLNGLGGLGEPVTASALIAAATSVVLPILNLLKGKEADPSDPVPAEYRPAPALPEPSDEDYVSAMVDDSAAVNDAPVETTPVATETDQEAPADPPLEGYLGAVRAAKQAAVKKNPVTAKAKTKAGVKDVVKKTAVAKKPIAAKAKSPAVKKAVAAKVAGKKPVVGVKPAVETKPLHKRPVPPKAPIVTKAKTSAVKKAVDAKKANPKGATSNGRSPAVADAIARKKAGKKNTPANRRPSPANQPSTVVQQDGSTIPGSAVLESKPIARRPVAARGNDDNAVNTEMTREVAAGDAISQMDEEGNYIPKVDLPQKAVIPTKDTREKAEQVAAKTNKDPTNASKVQQAITEIVNSGKTIVENGKRILRPGSTTSASPKQPTYIPQGSTVETGYGDDPTVVDPSITVDPAETSLAPGGTMDPTASAVPMIRKSGFFSDSAINPATGEITDKTNWANVGLTGAGLLLAGYVLMGKSGGSTRQGGHSAKRLDGSGSYKPKPVLSGTPSRKARKRKSKSASRSLSGLAPVDLQ